MSQFVVGKIEELRSGTPQGASDVEGDVVRLTRQQRAMLQVAATHGHAFALDGVQSRAGGARHRMALRLGEMGLLSKRAPFVITDAGRAALKAHNDLDEPRRP